jgi:hypothetical protein
MHVQTNMATGSEAWFTRMQADAYLDLDALRPGVGSNDALSRHRCSGGVHSAVEGDEETISRDVDLAAIRRLEGST